MTTVVRVETDCVSMFVGGVVLVCCLYWGRNRFCTDVCWLLLVVVGCWCCCCCCCLLSLFVGVDVVDVVDVVVVIVIVVVVVGCWFVCLFVVCMLLIVAVVVCSLFACC